LRLSKLSLEAGGWPGRLAAIAGGRIRRRSLPPLPKLRHPALACEKLGDEGCQGPRAGAGCMGALVRQQDEGPSRMVLRRLM
ncbi:MAG TPA: hypothetical protein VHN20_09895, partial [Beijerinckiaceae bacterium]|nr:hypothetical protein [Beijerinckiaceae bacterium]